MIEADSYEILQISKLNILVEILDYYCQPVVWNHKAEQNSQTEDDGL